MQFLEYDTNHKSLPSVALCMERNFHNVRAMMMLKQQLASKQASGEPQQSVRCSAE